MKKEYRKQENLKIVFSLISILLMIQPLINGQNSYYRTLFIFLINRVIDISFETENKEGIFFTIWSLINQWIGVIASAVAFCALTPGFMTIFNSYSKNVSIFLLVSAISCVFKEMLILIIISVKEKLILEKIESDLK